MKLTKLVHNIMEESVYNLSLLDDKVSDKRITREEYVQGVLEELSGTFGAVFAVLERAANDIEKIEEQLDKREKVQ